MKRFHFINSLSPGLKEVYYNAITSDTIINEDDWLKIKGEIEKFRDTNISADEIATLLKYQPSEDKQLLISLIKKNGKYSYLLNNTIFTFEEIAQVEPSIVSDALSYFSMNDIVTACMATSPQVVSIIKELVDLEKFTEIEKKTGSVSIDEITRIHESIINRINSKL